MINLRKRKGITLVELIITLGLIGVITGLVFSFFFSNKKTLNNVEIKTDLQYEAKIIMNEISKYAMEAKKAEYSAEDTTLRFIAVDGSSTVFTVNGGTSSESGEKVIFTGNEITVGNGSSSDATLSINFKELSLHGERDKSININLTLEKDGIEYSVADSFLFRNRE